MGQSRSSVWHVWGNTGVTFLSGLWPGETLDAFAGLMSVLGGKQTLVPSVRYGWKADISLACPNLIDKATVKQMERMGREGWGPMDAVECAAPPSIGVQLPTRSPRRTLIDA